jgi:hypothetical protein
MSKMSDGGGRHVIGVSAPTLILLVPFVGYLRYHDYPLLTLEVLVSLLLILGAGLALYLLWVRCGAKLRAMVSALPMIAAVDTHLGMDWVRAVTASGGESFVLPILLVSVTGTVALFWALRRHLQLIIVVVAGAMLAGTFLLPFKTIAIGERTAPHDQPKQSQPPIVHLILDEHIGIEGLPTEISGATEWGESLRAFYQRSDFTLFGAAYSLFFDTDESMATLLNGAMDPDRASLISGPDGHRRIHVNGWFKKLVQKGYQIRVYQSEYLDFCNAKDADVTYCFTYPANSIRSIAHTDISLSDKLGLIFSRLASRSLSYRIAKAPIRSSHAAPTTVLETDEVWLGGLSALPVFGRIASDMRTQARGTVFFAHLLLPHSSYIFDRDCSMSKEPWLRNFDPSQPWWGNTPASRRQRYALYIEQMRCTQRELAKLFEQMKALGIFDDALIIVHGDHGSRIAINSPSFENRESLSDNDLRDNYSTLMAIHTREFEGRYSGERRSIQSLFADLIMENSASDETADVYLRRGRDEAERHSMSMAWGE